eukprot:364935-Chlamydomonas_euryale.AAC.15
MQQIQERAKNRHVDMLANGSESRDVMRDEVVPASKKTRARSELVGVERSHLLPQSQAERTREPPQPERISPPAATFPPSPPPASGRAWDDVDAVPSNPSVGRFVPRRLFRGEIAGADGRHVTSGMMTRRPPMQPEATGARPVGAGAAMPSLGGLARRRRIPQRGSQTETAARRHGGRAGLDGVHLDADPFRGLLLRPAAGFELRPGRVGPALLETSSPGAAGVVPS